MRPCAHSNTVSQCNKLRTRSSSGLVGGLCGWEQMLQRPSESKGVGQHHEQRCSSRQGGQQVGQPHSRVAAAVEGRVPRPSASSRRRSRRWASHSHAAARPRAAISSLPMHAHSQRQPRRTPNAVTTHSWPNGQTRAKHEF